MSTAAMPQSQGGREGSLMPREIIAWLQSLQLSRPIKHPKRDLSNGYLIAEICSKYWPTLVSMHAFENKLSVPNKLSNWVVLRKIFDKHDICLSDKMVTGMVQCKAQYAEAFLRQLYTLLTGRVVREAPPPVAATVAMPKYTPGSFMPHMKDSMEVYQHLTQQTQQQQEGGSGGEYEAGQQGMMNGEGTNITDERYGSRGQSQSESNAAREAHRITTTTTAGLTQGSGAMKALNNIALANSFFGEAPMSSAQRSATPVLRPIAEAALSDSYVSHDESIEVDDDDEENVGDNNDEEEEGGMPPASTSSSPAAAGKAHKKSEGRRPRFAVTVQATTQSTTVQPTSTTANTSEGQGDTKAPHARSASHAEHEGEDNNNSNSDKNDAGGCVGLLDRTVRRIAGRREWRLSAECPRYIDYFLQHDRDLPAGLQNQIWTALFGQLSECVRRVRLHSLALAELALVLLQLPHGNPSHSAERRVNSRAFHLLAALLAHLADTDPHYTHATFVQSLLPLPALQTALKAMDYSSAELYSSLVAAVVPNDRSTARSLMPGLLSALHAALITAHGTDAVHGELSFLLILRALVRRLVRVAHGAAFGQAPHAALVLGASRDGDDVENNAEDDMHTFLLRHAIAHTVAALSAESPQLRLGGAALAVTLSEVGCPCTTLLHTLLPLLFASTTTTGTSVTPMRVMPPSLSASPLFSVMQAMWLHSAQERCAMLLAQQQAQLSQQQQQKVIHGRGGSLQRRSLPSTQGRRSNASHFENALSMTGDNNNIHNSNSSSHGIGEQNVTPRHLSWFERQCAAARELQQRMGPLIAELCRLVRAPGGQLRCKAIMSYELACTLPFLPDEHTTQTARVPSASFSMATTNATSAMPAVTSETLVEEAQHTRKDLKETVAMTVMYFYGQRATPELIALALAAPGPASGTNNTASGARRVQVIAEGQTNANTTSNTNGRDGSRHTSLLHPSLSALPGAMSSSGLNNPNMRPLTPANTNNNANGSAVGNMPHACVWQHAILGPLCTPELIAHSCPVLLAAALPSVFVMTLDKRDAGRRLAARALALAREKVAPAYLASRITWLYAIVMSHSRGDALTLGSHNNTTSNSCCGMESAEVQRRWAQVLRQSYDDIALITTAAELALRQHSRNADDNLAALLELAAKAQRIVVRCYQDRLTGAGANNSEAGSRAGSLGSPTEAAVEVVEQATMAEAMAWYHETFREVDL